MKIRHLSWKYESDKGLLAMVSAATKFVLGIFNICDLFPGFLEMSPAQKCIVQFGIRQKLADAGASEGSTTGKAKEAKALWDELLSEEFSEKTSRGAMSAEDKLARALEDFDAASQKLEEYLAMDDSEKRIAAKFGVSKTSIEKEIATIEKRVAKLEKEVTDSETEV